MHEISLAAELIDIVRRTIAPEEASHVEIVTVRVGPLSGVVPESLAFAFDVLKCDAPFPEAQLRIESSTISCRCRACGVEPTDIDVPGICPVCGSVGLVYRTGAELDIVDVALRDVPEVVA